MPFRYWEAVHNVSDGVILVISFKLSYHTTNLRSCNPPALQNGWVLSQIYSTDLTFIQSIQLFMLKHNVPISEMMLFFSLLTTLLRNTQLVYIGICVFQIFFICSIIHTKADAKLLLSDLIIADCINGLINIARYSISRDLVSFCVSCLNFILDLI